MFREIKRFLYQPYPDRDDLKSILISGVSSGFIVFFILYAFRPFDINNAPNVLDTALAFGIITTLTSVFFDMIMIHVFGINREHPSWTFLRWIFYVVGLMVCIAIANYVYMTIGILHQPFYWVGLWIMLRGVLLIGIFPITIFGGLKMIRLLRQNQKLAADISPSSQEIQPSSSIDLPIHKSADTWSIDPNKIYYIEAQQNYVAIIYESDNGPLKEILRNTLSAISHVLQDTPIIRCHRSYLVNKSRIHQISGNAQGLKLHLKDYEGKTIPVSRKYIPVFR